MKCLFHFNCTWLWKPIWEKAQHSGIKLNEVNLNKTLQCFHWGHLSLTQNLLWINYFQCSVIDYISKWAHLSCLSLDLVDTRGGWGCYQHEGEQPLFIFLCTLTTFIIYANNTLVYQYPGKVTCYLISCLFPLREMSLSKQKHPHMHILIKLHSVPVRSSKEMIGQHFSCLPALEVSRQSHHHFTLSEKFPVHSVRSDLVIVT